MDILFYVLSALCGLVILFLLFLMFWQALFVFIPRKEKGFKGDGKQRRFAIIIPAHNEESVIANSLERLKNDLDYPKDLYDIFVCADNCTDSTFSLAKEAGVIVYERHEDDPEKKRAAFPIQLLINEVLNSDKGYDAIIKFDADNVPSRNFLEEMNRALGDGVEICRAHESSSNLGQNCWTQVAGVYYARDSRLACNFRERAGWNSMLSGAGMMVAVPLLRELGGWDAMSAIDDAEFAVKRMLEGRRIHYASKAIVYEDQPSTRKDSANRNARMGNALAKLYWKEGKRLFGKFFKTGKATYLDMFSQLSFVPVPMILGISIGVYAAFFYTTLILQACGIAIYPEYLFTSGLGGSAFFAIIVSLIAIGGFLILFYILWTYQSFLGVYLDRKILGKNWWKDSWKGVIFGAFLMATYSISITSGVSKKKVRWVAIKRNSPSDKR